ncbi:MAG: hypothetical protein U0941_29935 [Planctomycetaceae bacterium]
MTMTPINGQRLFFIGSDEIWMGEDLESCQIARGHLGLDHNEPVELTDEIVNAQIVCEEINRLDFKTIAQFAKFHLMACSTPMLLLTCFRRKDLEQATGQKLPRKPVDQGQIIERLLAVIGTICTSDCITDVIWLADQNGSTDQNVTVCEEIADIAHELGATDLQIDSAFNWRMPSQPSPVEEHDPNEVPF